MAVEDRFVLNLIRTDDGALTSFWDNKSKMFQEPDELRSWKLPGDATALRDYLQAKFTV